VVEVKIYRAGSESEKGVKAFSSWSEDRSTAEAYLDNQGFGGSVLRSAVIHPNNVLDADTTNRRGMVKLAQSLGFDPSEGEEWFDAGWRYPWEESKRVKSAASSSAFDAIRYVDDFPEGALTIITTRDFKPEEEERLNPHQLMGININDSTQDFTGQILRGEKTIETRPSRSLDSRIGKLTGIIRTGVGKATLVGYAVIGEPVVYDSVAKFRRDYSKHRVAPGSIHDIKDGLKYGYPLMQVKRVTPRAITSSGRVIRKLNPLTYPADQITYAALTPTPANTDIAAGKTLWETPAFKKWFGDSKVRDLASRPAVLYHGTCSSGFTKFDPTKTREMGFHFGTSSQAKDFLKGCGTYRGKTPGIYPVYLSIQKPLFTPDVYSESPTFFIEWLEKTNHTYDWFTDEDDSYYRSLNKLRSQLVEANLLTGEGSHGYRQKIFKTVWGLLRKIVMRKGYDGIRYKNENEGNTDDPYNMAWIAFSPAQVKSATENRGTFNRRDPDLRNPMITNPMDPRSAMTQIAGTKKTYAKAAKMLGGKVLDYGAGLGIGTDILRAEGLLTDSFEPYPEKWKGKRPPTYTDSAKIPSSSYDSLVSFSVINVVEPDMRKFLFEEVARILRSGGIALITGRDRNDVEKATIKIPHLEEGGYLIDEGEDQRYQKGFTQKELEQYAKKVLGPDFTVQKNGSLNGASIKITKGKTNPVNRSMIRSKLSRIIEPGDRVLDYDRAQGEDLYRLWDLVHTDMALTPEALVEIEGMLDDDGVLVIQSGEEPAGLRDHFRRVVKYQGMLLVQGPMNPEEARINTEKLRRDLE
jgi:SAM-dependent methyltransferase